MTDRQRDRQGHADRILKHDKKENVDGIRHSAVHDQISNSQ